MTRAALRALLQRQLNDVMAHDFSEPVLNDALDHGALETMKVQTALQPDSVKAIATDNVVLGNEFIPKPPDTWMLYKVQLLTDGSYVTIEKRDYDTLDGRGEGGTSVWA